jgi:hypothetical protein
MSLILDALRKAERDKDAPDRGLVVVAAPSWTAPRAPAWLIAVGAAAIGAAVAVVAIRPARPAVATPPAPPVTVASGGQVLPRAAEGRVVPAPAPVTRPPATPARPVEQRAAAAPAARPAPAADVRALPEPPAAASDDPALHLHAISERDGRPVAVVNETVVEIGDVVAGARVLRIGAGEVELERERDGRRVLLRF